MKHILTTLLLCCAMSLAYAAQPKVLVFSKTKGFRHDAIPVGKLAIMKLGQDNNFAVDTTEDAGAFTEENLRQYKVVIFLHTTGDVLDSAQQVAFQHFIEHGGGYVGVHAATDTEYDWPWYGKLAGAYFTSHPAQQEAVLHVADRHRSFSTQALPDEWKRKDEWYNFRDIQPDLHVVLTIDEKTYTGGKNGDVHPMAWWHEYDGGRAFYTELGHTKESYYDPLYLGHLLGGIDYALGRKKGSKNIGVITLSDTH